MLPASLGRCTGPSPGAAGLPNSRETVSLPWTPVPLDTAWGAHVALTSDTGCGAWPPAFRAGSSKSAAARALLRLSTWLQQLRVRGTLDFVSRFTVKDYNSGTARRKGCLERGARHPPSTCPRPGSSATPVPERRSRRLHHWVCEHTFLGGGMVVVTAGVLLTPNPFRA